MEKKDKVFVIGKKKELKVTLKNDRVAIFDTVEPKHNGEYFYTAIKEANLYEGGFDLLATIANWLISVFTDYVADAYQKNTPFFEIKTQTENLKIFLGKPDIAIASEILESLYERKNVQIESKTKTILRVK